MNHPMAYTLATSNSARGHPTLGVQQKCLGLLTSMRMLNISPPPGTCLRRHSLPQPDHFFFYALVLEQK